MEAAAVADVFGGGSGWALLSSSDPAVSIVLQRVASRAAELARKRDENLAVLIANAVGKAISGK